MALKIGATASFHLSSERKIDRAINALESTSQRCHPGLPRSVTAPYSGP